MSVVLQVENLTKSFGADILFSNISFGLDEGDKVGIIAKNGTGKSTLLNILAGQDTPDSGSIIFRNGINVGYLDQNPTFENARTIIDICFEGDDPASVAVRDYENALNNDDAQAISDASAAVDQAHAWHHVERFKKLLSQLKINNIYQTVDTLSGGQLKRAALAKILLNEPQMLILDEPTNHLDIDIIEWLENFLSHNRMSLILVTHDRYFLDNVCNRIIEIDQQQIFQYDGNYNYYLQRRAERLEAQAAATERARNLLRNELEWMRRQPQARQHKAQYRIDAFYDLQQQARSNIDNSQVRLDVKSQYIGKKIFNANNVCKRFGDNIILNNFNYIFARYEKLGIVGDNGVGKTTFIRLLLGELQPDSGSFDIGKTVQFGYYSQDGISFNENQRVIDAARDIAEVVYLDEKTQYTAAQFLSLFLFSTRDQQKLIAKLSGGEKRRLYLATVLMRKPNFLILDEPTNDLDITTLEILENYLQSFKGCVIIVSHDRFFMDRTVDHTFVFLGNGVVKDFPGNYSEYRAWKEAHQYDNSTKQTAKSKTNSWRQPRDNSNKLTYAERQELERLPAEIEELTQEKDALDALFASGEEIPDIAAKAAHYEEVKALLDQKELRWLQLDEKEK